jgi:uridine kinase
MSSTGKVPASQRTETIRAERKEVPKLGLDDGLRFLEDRINEKLKTCDCVIVEVAGGSASGKTSMVAKKLVKRFENIATMMSIDNYCKGKKFIEDNKLNYDHPGCIEMDLLREHLSMLKSGKHVDGPEYSFKTCEREEKTIPIEPKRIIVVEGLHALNDELAGIGDVKVFVEVDEHGGIFRRLFRDKDRSSWSSAGNLKYMLQTVIPMYRRYIIPTEENADVIISNEYDPKTEGRDAGTCEAQVKFRADFSGEQLLRIGAERIMAAKQVDSYYNTKSGSFRITGELLRVREESGKKVLTYKSPRTSDFAYERQKLEFEIDPETEKEISTIYFLEQKVEKERTVYLFRGIMVSLDMNVTKEGDCGKKILGNFIELKMEHYKEDETLKELIASLKIRSDAICASYSEM